MSNAEPTATNDDLGTSPDLIPVPYLFVLFYCGHPKDPPTRHMLDGVEIIRFGRGDKRAVSREVDDGTCYLDVRVPDAWMSTTHARITRGTENWLFEDLSSKNGSLINGVKRNRVLLEDGDLLELGHTFFTFRMLRGEDFDAAKEPPALPELTTMLPDLHRQFVRLDRAAKTGLSILLTGETGTGKEMLARAAHRLSERSGNFMAINCGALASTVIEAELFGVKRGAFTGADRDREGLIRAAQGGTLFLDEIGELPLASQTTFLRVLQEREVVPVGGTHPIKVDFRLVSATNRDLSALVGKEAFRDDLLSRISGFGMRVPALRHRREDLAVLVPALIARHTKKGAQPPSVRPAAMRALMMYHWPANVRELEKCLEAAVAFTDRPAIELADLPEAVQDAVRSTEAGVPARSEAGPTQGHLDLTPREQKLREELIGMLRVHEGNVSKVARAMSKGRNQVVRWMEKFQLDRHDFRSP